MKPSVPSAGKIDFGAKPEMKMQIISKSPAFASKPPPPRVGLFEKPVKLQGREELKDDSMSDEEDVPNEDPMQTPKFKMNSSLKDSK